MALNISILGKIYFRSVVNDYILLRWMQQSDWRGYVDVVSVDFYFSWTKTQHRCYHCSSNYRPIALSLFIFSSSSNRQCWASYQSMESCSSGEKLASSKYFRFAYSKTTSHSSNPPWLLVPLFVNYYSIQRLRAVLGEPCKYIWRHTESKYELETEQGCARVGFVLQSMGKAATGAELCFSLHRRQIQPESIVKKITALPSDSHEEIQVWHTTQPTMTRCKRKLQRSFQVTESERMGIFPLPCVCWVQSDLLLFAKQLICKAQHAGLGSGADTPVGGTGT